MLDPLFLAISFAIPCDEVSRSSNKEPSNIRVPVARVNFIRASSSRGHKCLAKKGQRCVVELIHPKEKQEGAVEISRMVRDR